jgi:HSP20 family protein
MALVRWDPIRELAGVEVDKLNRMFSDFFNEGVARAWVPPVDIYESDNHEVVVKAELPDMKREQISVTVDNNVLTLKGERSTPEVDRDRFRHVERHYGAFSRSFTLPNTIDAGRITASYKDGVLTVRIPQREEARPKQIAVGID